MSSEKRIRAQKLLLRGDASGAEVELAAGLRLALAGDWEDGGDFIEVEDGAHLLAADRAVALLRIGKNQEALNSARLAVKLRPEWPVGLHRCGQALLALSRPSEALRDLQKAAQRDSSSSSLKIDVDRAEQALRNQDNDDDQKVLVDEKKASDDPLGNFLEEIEELERQPTRKRKRTASVYKVDHEKETNGWTTENQMARVLQKNYKWVNTNPFAVFGFRNEEATSEDVKKRFHKLSSLIHPDKNPSEQAEEAFQELTRAHERLKDEESRKRFSEIISQCKSRVREARGNLRNGQILSNDEADLAHGDIEEAFDRATKKEFALREHRRRKAELNHQSYQEREKMKEDNESEYWRKVKEAEEMVKEGTGERSKNWKKFTNRNLKK